MTYAVAEAVEEVIINMNKEEFIFLQTQEDFLKHIAPYVSLEEVQMVRSEKKEENNKQIIEICLHQFPDEKKSSGHKYVKNYLNVEKLKYEVVQKINLKECSFTFDLTPPMMQDYVEIFGDCKAYDHEDGKCKILFKTCLCLKFFGGGVIGRLIIGQFVGGFVDYPEAVESWKKLQNLDID
eukprot:gene9557-1760_t